MKMFAGGFLRLSGANSSSSLASMSIRIYLGDEIDKYPPSAGKEGDPVQLAIERTSTFWNSLVFLVSTPSIKENSRIEAEYEQSDKRLCFVPCPHCGHYQHLSWDRFEYVGKGTCEAEPLSGVYFICEKCDRRIEEKYKTQMISQKQWRATAKPQNPGHIGFQLSRFYSPWGRWTDIALNYEAARNDPQQLQVFWNATLGLPYEKVAGEKLDWERLRDRASGSGYQKGFVPRGGLLLTAGVDRAKETLCARSQIEATGAKYLNFPNDLDSNWFEGFCSEVQVTQHKNGRPYIVWEKLAGVRNEPLDTSVYALAAANLVGVQRIRWASEVKKLEAQNVSSEEVKKAIANYSLLQNP